MASTEAVDFRLDVLCPGGRDPEQYFDQPVTPDSGGHAPVNFHAFAACTGGAFHRDVKNALAENTPLLLLLRGDFKASQRALIACKNEKRTVIVSLKETGLHQIAQQMSDGGRISRFFEIMALADGCLATTPEAADLYRQARGKLDQATVGFIPTPYPLEDPTWNFAVKPDGQVGIFIGTREWDVPSRNHFAALFIARQLCEATGEPVTVFNLDGRRGEKRLAGLKFPSGKLRTIKKRQPYADYLRERRGTKLCCNWIAAVCRVRWRVIRFFAARFASGAMERSSALLFPTPAAMAAPSIKFFPSPRICLRAQTPGLPRSWNHSGARSNGSPFEPVEHSLETFSRPSKVNRRRDGARPSRLISVL